MKTVVLTVIMMLCVVGGMFGSLYCQNSEKVGNEMLSQDQVENSSTLSLSDVCITVVYDNNSYKSELTTAWGFSCVVTGAEKTILFDTGEDGSILLSNMEKMEIHPEEIDLVVLSHVHTDHTGGLERFLENNEAVEVYVPKTFPESFKDNVKQSGAKIVDVQEPVEICNHVYSTGVLGIMIKEQSLVVHTDAGLIVITGCAHPGIVTIIEQAQQVVDDDVLLVMGGFHLGGESRESIREIIADFRRLGVRFAGPTHCTGDVARQLFETEYQTHSISVGVGREITADTFQ